jgi:hypothetical protein
MLVFNDSLWFFVVSDHLWGYSCIFYEYIKTDFYWLKSSEIIWNHLKSSDIIWNHLKSPEIIWNHLTSSEIIWNHPKSSEIIWNHLKSSEITWNHLKSSEIIWNHLKSFEITEIKKSRNQFVPPLLLALRGTTGNFKKFNW